MMSNLDIANVDQLFLSERDQQPYVVLYGKRPANANDLVAYEQTGVGGKRLVGYSIGLIAEVDEAQFQELVSQQQSTNEP